MVPAGRDVNVSYRIDVPSLSLPGPPAPQRRPSMLFLAGQLLHGRRQENSASEPAGDTAKLGRHG